MGRKGIGKFAIFIVAVVMCVIAGCACGAEKKSGTPVEISYLNNDETKLVTETHYLQSTDVKEMIVEVLTLLCCVPENRELKATIPSNINVVNYSFDGEQVTVSLSEKYRELARTTEVLTRAAIVRSLTAVPEVNYVMLTINGEPLIDGSGAPVGVMTADMFVDNAGTQQVEAVGKVTLKLYFANEDGDGLIEINRELVHNADASNVPMERLVIEQLISGPANGESYPTINPATKILGVTVRDGVCHIDFDSTFMTPVNNVTSDVTIYSIVNSLAELSNINKVQISIDGNASGKFRDKYDLGTVFERNLEIVE